MPVNRQLPAAASALENLLQRAASCPYYQDAVAAVAPLAPLALSSLPATRYEDLLRDQRAHPPQGRRRLPAAAAAVRAGCTGSGDSLLLLTWTAADLASERAAGVRVLSSLGLRPAMRVANTLSGALTTPGSLLLGDVVDELGGLDIPLGAIDSEAAAKQAWELVDRIEPDVLVLDPQTAGRFFGAAPPAVRRWLAGVVWLRTDSSPAPPAIPAPVGMIGWQRTWFGVAAARSFVAASCAQGRLHVDSDVLAEVVAEDTALPLLGEAGHLALTPLSGDSLLLRYVTTVKARQLTQPCACGSMGPAFEVP